MSRAFAFEIVAVLVFGVGLAIHLGGRVNRYVDAPADFAIETLAEGETESWMGIYFGDQKAGFSVRRQAPIEGGGLLIRERTELKVRSFGMDKDVRLRVDAVVGADQLIERFSAHLFTDPIAAGAEALRRGDKLEITLTAGSAVIQTMTLPADGALQGNALRKLVRSKPAPGTRHKLTFLSPETLSSQQSEVLIVGREEVPGLPGTEGLRVVVKLGSAEADTWLDDEGEILRQEGMSGLEMVMVRESRDDALSKGWDPDSPPDIIALSAVPLTGVPIEDRSMERVRLRIRGSETVQRLLKDQYGDAYQDGVIEIVKEDIATVEDYVLPAEDSRFLSTLAAEPLIEADDPRIAAIVGEVMRGDAEATTAGRRFTAWVFRSIAKEPVLGLPGAITTLESGKGDCNEHTALFTALARNAGLPTRVAAGVVWSDSVLRSGAFYYHAWPEVWIGRWVPVDPTFGQFPADPTHLRLVTGSLSAQTDLVGVIGAIEIEVLAVE